MARRPERSEACTSSFVFVVPGSETGIRSSSVSPGGRADDWERVCVHSSDILMGGERRLTEVDVYSQCITLSPSCRCCCCQYRCFLLIIGICLIIKPVYAVEEDESFLYRTPDLSPSSPLTAELIIFDSVFHNKRRERLEVFISLLLLISVCLTCSVLEHPESKKRHHYKLHSCTVDALINTFT